MRVVAKTADELCRQARRCKPRSARKAQLLMDASRLRLKELKREILSDRRNGKSNV